MGSAQSFGQEIQETAALQKSAALPNGWKRSIPNQGLREVQGHERARKNSRKRRRKERRKIARR